MLVVNVYPYKGREQRLKLTRELKGKIIIEMDYIVQILNEGAKQ